MDNPPCAAIRFHADAYDIRSQTLLGRQSANHGLLRAAVAGRAGGAVKGYGVNPQLQAAFAATVSDIEPAATTQWALADQSDRLRGFGVLHRHDPRIQQEARWRLWNGVGLYSITGITHTTFNTLHDIAAMLQEPLMPWDALICASRSVLDTVQRVQAQQMEYLRWRHGAAVTVAAPQLPVIPLGVHSADYAFGDAERAAARGRLALAEDEIAVLYVGRLSIMTKAHPAQMFAALQAVATRSGRRLALIECGYYSAPRDMEAHRQGAALLCPDVRVLHVDGRDVAAKQACWAGADIFMSLSDNIQETFGLTPIEAMAAGLPVIVSDWDGYRETVRDGVDGFTVPTWTPRPGSGVGLAHAHQTDTLHPDLFCWAAAAATSVDVEILVDRLSQLTGNADLRRRMGEAGRERARSNFDWRHIYRRYQELWAELTARRLAADVEAAPRLGGQIDPFAAFASYPTAAIGDLTRVALTPGASPDRYRELSRHPLFPFQPANDQAVLALWPALAGGQRTVGDAATTAGLSPQAAIMTLGVLAKMGLVRFEA